VPEALLAQLSIGGTGWSCRSANPMPSRTWSRSPAAARRQFEQEDLGAGSLRAADRRPWLGRAGREGRYLVAGAIAAAAEPLPEIDDPAFAEAFDRFADARVVLLGEASHGTSEFYRARAAITRRLIERHGFNIVAVEADWPDAATSTATSATGRSARRARKRLRALPDLDVAQHASRRLHPLAAGHNEAAPMRRWPASTGSTSTISAARCAR
jgi:hypothetical protein